MTAKPTPITVALSRAGTLPPLPETVAETYTVQRSTTAFRIMDDLADITCFDGPAGTGKTTACAYAAAQSTRLWRYSVLPLRAHPKDLIARIYQSVFQRPAHGTERQMATALVERFCEGNIGLIADEVHHVGLPGAQQLRYLWDEAARLGSPFPLLLVGCDVRRELAKAEEVRSRVARWVFFDLVTEEDDVLAIAGALHPRLAATKPDMILKMNDRIARRRIRDWQRISKHIKYLPSTDATGKKVTGLTANDVRQLRDILGEEAAA
jgi:hypothetical protein